MPASKSLPRKSGAQVPSRGTLLLSMVVSIALANLLMPVALTPHLSLGTPLIAVSFAINGLTHQLHGRRAAKELVWRSFGLGLGLSLLLAPLRIALASGAAFVSGQLFDVTVFARLRRGRWWLAPLVSAVAASSLDTVIFFALAGLGNGGWWHFAAADWLCKVACDLVLLVPLRLCTSRPMAGYTPS